MARNREDNDDELVTRIKLKNVRLSYPALWKPKAFGKSNEGEPAYQANFIIDETTASGKRNIAKVEEAIENAKRKKWQGKPPKLKADKICFGPGDPDDGEEFENTMVLRSRSYRKPTVLDIDGEAVREGDEGAPYAGCYVDAIVEVWAQDNEYGKRINCSLEGVKFREDGEPFSGARPVTNDDFDDDDEDDDDRPRRSKRSRDDDDDERPSRRRSRDEDDEDERPSRRRSRDDDDEDERPSRRRSRDDDDEDERPSRRRSRDDDDEDERPSRRRSRDEDDDVDRPSRNSRARRRDDDDI